MLVYDYGGNSVQGYPMLDLYEPNNAQCPMSGQWQTSENTMCQTTVNSYRDPSLQCNRGDYRVADYSRQYQDVGYVQVQECPVNFTQSMQPCSVNYVQQEPVLNLPCQGQSWDYDMMCYNVDGQPCQYTNFVDLEDFMNNEKRKEKSRVAARCRRTRETEIFAELTAALPARKEEVEQLDKASIMRLAISYLRVRDVVTKLLQLENKLPLIKNPEGLEEVSSELSYMKALDGFVLVLSQQGDIVYCSENISEHLGVSQMEIMGQSVFEFSHPCDHDEVREALRSTGPGRRELLLRLKCTLTSKGRNVHLKSASYKVIHLTGHMLTPTDSDTKSDDEDKKAGSLVAVGRPIPHPSNIEIPLDNSTFLSKHSLDMKFTYSDDSLMKTLGFEPTEMVGKSLFEYHHAADSAALAQHFKSLFSKGQCETGQYRFLAKSGGYAWVQTQATLITDKQQKPNSIVCINYVISGIECRDEVFAAHQLQYADLKPVVAAQPPIPVPIAAPKIPQLIQTCLPEDVPNGAIVAVLTPEEERPIPVTELIFAPKPKEMSEGFLTFSPDEGLTMLKDEPEDLTYLAPTAGDGCIPLQSSPFNNMFDEFILSDNYCSLLGDDLVNGSPVDSLTADSLLLSSPEPLETDSSCEQTSLLTDLSLEAFDSGRTDTDIDDGNSPFIPSTDELPVLESVMWGALPENVSQARPQPSDLQNTSPAPALQRLLAAPPTGPPPQDLITNIYSDQGLIPSRSVSSWETGVKRVMRQDEEPSAKRVKRSPSPVQSLPAPSSSVLMNLLDMQQQQSTQLPSVRISNQNNLQYQMTVEQKQLPYNPNSKSIPYPVMQIIQNIPNKVTSRQSFVNNQMNTNLLTTMTPLSLNVSPMFSLPASPNTPNYSPALSPAHMERVMSPYTPQSMSPVGKFHQVYSPGNKRSIGSDPYLSYRMQPSPRLLQSPEDLLLDSGLASPDFWADTEMLQSTSDLLTALDDVKLD